MGFKPWTLEFVAVVTIRPQLATGQPRIRNGNLFKKHEISAHPLLIEVYFSSV